MTKLCLKEASWKLPYDILPSSGVLNLVMWTCLVRRESEKCNFYSGSAKLSCLFFFLVKEIGKNEY